MDLNLLFLIPSSNLEKSHFRKLDRKHRKGYWLLSLLLLVTIHALFLSTDIGKDDPCSNLGTRYGICSMIKDSFKITKSMDPVCIIDIMTSSKSFNRLDDYFKRYGYQHPLVLSGFFKFRIVYSDKLMYENYTDITHLRTPCGDNLTGVDGLICRVNHAQKTFPNTSRWHFRAMDDTFINLFELWKQIYFLEQIYNPKTDIVFRSFANWYFYTFPYVGGGSGWLASNAFVTHMGREIPSLEEAYYLSKKEQDDIIMYFIISNMFDKTDQWASIFYIDRPIENSVAEARECLTFKKRPFRKFSDAISLHTAAYSYLQGFAISEYGNEAAKFLFEEVNDSIRLISDYKNLITILCTNEDDAGISNSLAYENRSYKLVRPEMFANTPRTWWVELDFPEKSKVNLE